MGQEPGHSEVVNSLLDLQARLRGDQSEPEPRMGDTIVDAPPMMSEQPSRMPHETPAPEVTDLERNGTLSVTEAEMEITMSPAPPTEAPDLAAPAPPAPGSADLWNAARVLEVPAPPATDDPVGFEVPAPPLLQEPALGTPPSASAPQTREEQIAKLAGRIDRLEHELTFVAEELWRLATEPPPSADRSV